MPALIIIGIIVLLIVFLLRCNIRAEISYRADVFVIKVKYLFLTFTVFPIKEKEEKEKKPKRSKKDKKSKNISEENIAENIDENKDNTDEVTLSEAEVKDKLDDAAEYVSEPAEKAVKDEEKGEKKKSEDKMQLLKDRIEQVKIILKSVKEPLVRLFHGIRIDDLMIDIVAGGEDACEAAVNYGKMNAIVYNVISFVRMWFQISVKTVDIGCDFDAKKSVYNAEAKVKIRPCTILAVALTALFGYIKNKNELGSADVGTVNSDISTTNY